MDTRSDIYSQGVLLYELLTGTTPFHAESFRTAAFDEIRRIIREQEPPKPSTRLSTLGATLTTVSANRDSDPRKLSSSMRRELDWIVMRCLEKDRTRRYETAGGHAAEVRRYLDDEPVVACPPSSWYRLGKLARRHHAALMTADLVGVALLAGTVISSPAPVSFQGGWDGKKGWGAGNYSSYQKLLIDYRYYRYGLSRSRLGDHPSRAD